MENDINLFKDRAWIEIDLDNLKHNINEIKKVISDKTKIMAVVKANAYGHGSILIAKKLESIGITDFAVATLDEGIELRKNNISGNILILGYTNPTDLKYVIKYNLIQTIVDYDYSLAIKSLDLPSKLKCHVKINTGMNRIGEKFNDLDKIEDIYNNKKLEILGIFSHLCVADSNNEDDIKFTRMQIANFDNCIKNLKEKGYCIGLTHIQSSYGIINYNNLEYDYVRPGLIMYGVDGNDDIYKNIKLDLKPVLSLKARVTSIKEIDVGESISYGRTYVASSKQKIATVAIGYADGVPRCLSNKDVVVKINGTYKPILGKICMDQLVIDMNDVDDIKVGDTVYFIDSDDDKLSALSLADKACTITYEILSRLGSRLPRVKK